VQLPRLDGMQQKSAWFAALDRAGVSIRVYPVERARCRPGSSSAWRRRARASPRARGQKTLAFFADRIEGNLLAAHQEVQKLGLLYPPAS
jgi:DNA polymerase-3 subunit delta